MMLLDSLGQTQGTARGLGPAWEIVGGPWNRLGDTWRALDRVQMILEGLILMWINFVKFVKYMLKSVNIYEEGKVTHFLKICGNVTLSMEK